MATEKPLRITVRRSPLGRAQGLGAAQSGVHTWWRERVTAIALVPLSIWFVVSVLSLLGSPRAAAVAWAARPVDTVLLLALIVATFQHMALGLATVIEDYVHEERAKIASLLVMRATTILLGLGAVVAVLRMAFGRV